MSVEIERADGGYLLRAAITVPRPIEDVFAFFSDAGNLDAITPGRLRFEIVTPQPVAMREGALIDYRLKVRGVPMTWQSRITVWEPPRRFVDEQVRGPYRKWIHEHTFEPCDGGTIVRDEVRYAVPGGAIVHWLVVKRDVLAIFEHRSRRLRELFSDGP